MKGLNFFFTLFISVLFLSCIGSIMVGSQISSTIQVNFRRAYMEQYSSPYQGETLPVQIMIFVDKLNNNYEIESNFSTYAFQRTNSINGPENTMFPNIVVPESGSYSITAVAHGTACYTGCSSSTVCSGSNKGQPRLRKVTIIINAENAPDIIYMEPMGFVGCI